MEGNLASLRDLIDQGAYIDWQDGQGDTALITAARERHIEVCRELLRYGADTAKTNRWGSTAIHVASGYGHRQIVQLLASSGSDVNWMDIAGNTPSHCAAYWERIGVLEDLYNNGADWCIQNTEGKDVLQSAEAEKKFMSVQLINSILRAARSRTSKQQLKIGH
ncbi:ankyrin repeat domain-containing protein 2-like isoform X2 [Corticium candelabrum]|uniref:ankyrin repeat domain-containing protein 2-like isoform X2 n=1 Tax=Corticium candelabrum TaxID=121492 RepID=UPI002E26D1C4|nr:ankyrin repeat domain-containing protein 2-like isoform X2 [Corticium candelabrum]